MLAEESAGTFRPDQLINCPRLVPGGRDPLIEETDLQMRAADYEMNAGFPFRRLIHHGQRSPDMVSLVGFGRRFSPGEAVAWAGVLRRPSRFAQRVCAAVRGMREGSMENVVNPCLLAILNRSFPRIPWIRISSSGETVTIASCC